MVPTAVARLACATHQRADSAFRAPRAAGEAAAVVGTVAAPASVVAGGHGMSRHVRPLRRRDPMASDSLPADLSPLLRRIYAARQVTDAAQLATGLEALLPVSSLENVQPAARLLLQHRQGRILVVGDFDA